MEPRVGAGGVSVGLLRNPDEEAGKVAGVANQCAVDEVCEVPGAGGGRVVEGKAREVPPAAATCRLATSSQRDREWFGWRLGLGVWLAGWGPAASRDGSTWVTRALVGYEREDLWENNAIRSGS